MAPGLVACSCRVSGSNHCRWPVPAGPTTGSTWIVCLYEGEGEREERREREEEEGGGGGR